MACIERDSHCVEHIDLDSFVPTTINHLLRLMEQERKTSDHRSLNARLHFYRYYRRDVAEAKIGIEPIKLLDWRRLESRMHYVQTKLIKHSDKFWNNLASLHHQSNANVVCILSSDKQTAVEYNGRTLSHRKINDIISHARQNPLHRLCTISGEEAENIFKDYNYEYSLMLRVHVYKQAFMKAVEERLRTFINETKTHETPFMVLYKQSIFLIENDGRQYALYCRANGNVEWLDGNVVVCK